MNPASLVDSDAALARSIAETEAALQRERDAVAAAHRAAARARNLDDVYHYNNGYYYGAWRGGPYRPVVVHRDSADEYFLCVFLSSLFLIVIFIIVIIVLYAVYDDDDSSTDDDDASRRRLAALDLAAEYVKNKLGTLLTSSNFYRK